MRMIAALMVLLLTGAAGSAQALKEHMDETTGTIALVPVDWQPSSRDPDWEGVRLFSDDAGVIAVGSEYLRIIAWTFAGSGIIFVSSSMFQAMGNTIPPLAASFARIVLVAVPAIVMSRMQGFELWWIWYLSVGALAFQLVTVLVLLQREFRVRLTWPSVTTPSSATAGTH